jgi:hypothetical protein
VQKVAALITKLDDDDFAERERATAELEKLGLEALHQLRRTMEEPKSLEVRYRTQRLLAKLNRISLTPDHKRLQAVLYVFELMASDEARKVVDEVAGGKAGAWLAAEANEKTKAGEGLRDRSMRMAVKISKGDTVNNLAERCAAADRPQEGRLFRLQRLSPARRQQSELFANGGLIV